MTKISERHTSKFNFKRSFACDQKFLPLGETYPDSTYEILPEEAKNVCLKTISICDETWLHYYTTTNAKVKFRSRSAQKIILLIECNCTVSRIKHLEDIYTLIVQ